MQELTYKIRNLSDNGLIENTKVTELVNNGETITGMCIRDRDKTRQIERVASCVITSKSASVPLQTGIKAIDAMVPIGRGQRELIICLLYTSRCV